jgi:hypothetical protein
MQVERIAVSTAPGKRIAVSWKCLGVVRSAVAFRGEVGR